MSTAILAEAIGQNILSAVVPFELLHTAVFNTVLTVAAGIKLETGGLEKIGENASWISANDL